MKPYCFVSNLTDFYLRYIILPWNVLRKRFADKPQPGVVDLMLIDISGRVITHYSQDSPSGTHAISFNNLAEGVYFCTMLAGGFTATERLVVLK